MLARPIWDLLSRGGKHWRPIFGILLLQALGVEPAPYETMLAVIPELGHNAAVVIDDIEDASQTRRGEETIHLRYGLPTAINAANTLYFLPLLSISDHPHLTAGQRDAIYRLIIEMFVQAHFGQAQDLYWSKLEPDRR
ncbi:MAG TPA: polyprenyl synthetase family protein, partial [Hyphomicrobiales bacterium]|nr:polyprenyl synthetase family protein [Hyphomicrobiales bacterium]